MRQLDIVPDWAILVLAVVLVAGVFILFGGFGVLVLGIIATAIWIAQIMALTSTVRDDEGGTALRKRLHIVAPGPR